jgi:alpha-glucosidase
MIKKVIFPIAFLMLIFPAVAQTYSVFSPDGKVAFELSVFEKLTMSVYYKGKPIIQNSEFGLQFEQSVYLGTDMVVVSQNQAEVNEFWKPVIGQYTQVHNHANELKLSLKEKRFPAREIQLVLRAYNDGAAFRYIVSESFKKFIPDYAEGKTIPLIQENSSFSFTGDHTIWAANFGGYVSHQESEYDKIKLSDVGAGDIIGLPLLVQVEPDLYAAITEANLTDWAGMYLSAHPKADKKPFTLSTKLSPLPGSNVLVNVKPGSASPWRLLMIGEEPGDLIESQIIWNLNEPCAIKDPSWIKPGISAWDHWWSGEVKMDTETILKYIDLAADMGWEYMLIDWNWYGPPFAEEVGGRGDPDADITTVIDAVDMPKIIEYAKAKKVDLLLWLLWDHVEKQMDEAFPLYEQWGIKGVKIDFMQRDDQWMVNWYHKVVKKAAEHRLAVDFHGAYKPTGWTRTYPNLLTREGVLGNEYSKWSSRITPEHTTTLPFTRMLAGQMDFTPGAFLNKSMGQFENGAPAQAMGTRCNQLAMFVVYYSPLTVACDHPDNYKNQPGIEFLKKVPTVWDDTKVINGKVGEYITMARRKDNTWFIGAMTNSEARTLTIDLDFLGEGKWEIHYFKDAKDANVHAEKLEMGSAKVTMESELVLTMAPGGGYAAYIVRK